VIQYCANRDKLQSDLILKPKSERCGIGFTVNGVDAERR
jgi:hypothetical protein